jgi:hypothetical protein
MGKRGSNAFKRNDAIRAVESARAAGIDPGMLEVVVNSDGSTTFRVYADRVAPPAADPIIRSAKEWDEEIAKLKAVPPKPKRGR